MIKINTHWRHKAPTHDEARYDLQLLTIGGISVLGRWKGVLGQYYVGWAPLLDTTPAQRLPYPANTPPDLLFQRAESPQYAH